MSNSISAVTTMLVSETPIKDAHVSDGGLVISDMHAVLADFGADLDRLRPYLPEIKAGGIQKALRGAIQDPAGSALGTGLAPTGSGASGAIYAHFSDLKPIPNIPDSASIFNTSTGPGRRVLHTHSPQLTTSPQTADGRGQAMTAIANGHATALIAFYRHKATLGQDSALLNLTLLSAGIYAGKFANPALGHPPGHLDPTYSLTAIALAIDAVLSAGEAKVSKLNVYYFEDSVRLNAESAMARLSGT